MRENAVIDLIRKLCDERSWSCYKLAKESGIAYSTLSTMFRKTNTPSVETIIKICDALGSHFLSFSLQRREKVRQAKGHFCTCANGKNLHRMNRMKSADISPIY